MFRDYFLHQPIPISEVAWCPYIFGCESCVTWGSRRRGLPVVDVVVLAAPAPVLVGEAVDLQELLPAESGHPSEVARVRQPAHGEGGRERERERERERVSGWMDGGVDGIDECRG